MHTAPLHALARNVIAAGAPSAAAPAAAAASPDRSGGPPSPADGCDAPEALPAPEAAKAAEAPATVPELPSPLPIAAVPGHGRGVRVVDGGGDWPGSTSTWCWYCCHPFEGPPLPMPIQYDSRRDIFTVTGTFCSWACMKAYNLDSSSYMRHVNATFITLFHKRCTGKLQGIRPAPPRLALRAFGGTMSIEEFRGCDASMLVMPPKMIMHRPVIEEIPARLRDRPTPQQLQDSVSFKDSTAQNDMLRLRRPKPLTSHNLLVRTMGVQILGGQPQPQQPPPPQQP